MIRGEKAGCADSSFKKGVFGADPTIIEKVKKSSAGLDGSSFKKGAFISESAVSEKRHSSDALITVPLKKEPFDK